MRAPRLPRAAVAAVAVALALPLAAAMHRARPAPYGDVLTVRAVRSDDPVGGRAGVRLRTGRAGRVVEGYDEVTGRRRWAYARTGRRPLAVRDIAPYAVALWDDGMVTGSDLRGGAVRWHRAVPGAAERRVGVLQPLDPANHVLAVISPDRIAAYRTDDGDLRWVVPARRGCVFQPSRTVRLPTPGGVTSAALVVAQPCADPRTTWTSQLIAIDGFGRIAPHRRLPGKAVAAPR